MLRKKGKLLLVIVAGISLLYPLTKYDSQLDNQVEADNKEKIEKVSYSDSEKEAEEFDVEAEISEDSFSNDDEVTDLSDMSETEVSEDTDEDATTEESVNDVSEPIIEDTDVALPQNDSANESVVTGNSTHNSEENNEVGSSEANNETDSVGNTNSENNDTVTPADVEKDVINDSRPVSVQLLSNGEQVGDFIYGEKFSYYGNKDNLQFRRASGDLLDVYIGDTYHLDENYEDAYGINREIIATSSSGMAIVNSLDDGGYVVYMLYPH